MMPRTLLLGIILVWLSLRAYADEPPGDLLTSASARAALAGTLRATLVEQMPVVLHEDNKNWGQQKQVSKPGKLIRKLEGKEPQYTWKNDGLWRRTLVTAPNLRDTLVFDLRDFNRPENGRLLFTAFLSFDGRAEMEQQQWEDGLRIYSTSVRARFRLHLALYCELTMRLENSGGLLPDAVIRLRVVKSDLKLDNVVVEHIAGVGGDLAQILGDGIRGSLKQWRPSLETRLVEKANRALVKAGDTKEVRLGFGALAGGKDPLSAVPLPGLPAKKP
jgi:hypothetical protein